MQNTPIHVGIIMDGNRRWAKKRVLGGHRKGADTLKKIARHAANKGVRYLSVFAFSTENWKRPPEEVEYLFNLFREAFETHIEELEEEDIGIAFLGDLSGLPQDIAAKAAEVEQRSRARPQDKRMWLLICLNYGGRDEIARAASQLVHDAIMHRVAPGVIYNVSALERELEARLDTARRGAPDPDLIIRTSGEQRLSGFLLWQSVYAEIYFVKKHWPDFKPRDLDKALAAYSKRQRRMGR